MAIKNILMVCLGNICRSPLAEGILQSKLDNSFYVDSAGTAGYHIGEKPDSRSIAVAIKHNINLSKQRSRKFAISDFDTFDIIYAMDVSNYNNIIALAKKDTHKIKVKLILDETHPKQHKEIPDPYYGGTKGFENVYALLNKACDVIAFNLKNNHV